MTVLVIMDSAMGQIPHSTQCISSLELKLNNKLNNVLIIWALTKFVKTLIRAFFVLGKTSHL